MPDRTAIQTILGQLLDRSHLRFLPCGYVEGQKRIGGRSGRGWTLRWAGFSAAAGLALLAGALTALGSATDQPSRATNALPPWAAVKLPAHHVVGPAILVGRHPLMHRGRAAKAERKPVITRQPRSQTALAGHTVSFVATASGTPAPGAEWERSVNGGRTWSAVAHGNGQTYVFVARTRQTGYRYRVIFRNPRGKATSHAATLTVTNPAALSPPNITRQPAGETVTSADTATFTATATGKPAPTVRWEVSRDGGSSWTAIPGATSTGYSFAALQSENGYRYRAVFTNSSGAATTSSAALHVTAPPVGKPTITKQPTNQTALMGASASFTATASANPRPTVQWEVSSDRGGSWSTVTGATAATLAVSTVTQQFSEYRAVFTNSVGTATSKPATLTIAQEAKNWSGYAATGTGFTGVTGSWTVPTITCSGAGITYSAQWIGIDGYAGNTVEQDGTEADCVAGTAYYGAWYEMYGDNAVNNGYEVPLSPSRYPVYPGDSMTATITVSGTNWTLNISDATRSWSASIPITWSGPERSSAEWIMERPGIGSGGQLASLANFGSTSFTGVERERRGEQRVDLVLRVRAARDGQQLSEPAGRAGAARWSGCEL